MISIFGKSGIFRSKPSPHLGQFWDTSEMSESGVLSAPHRKGFMYEVEGLDGSFLSPEQLVLLHQRWRSALQLSDKDEVQIVFRKRVEFSEWVENQLRQSFLGKSAYGRRLLMDHLSDQVGQMGENEPHLFSQKIIVCFWTREDLDIEETNAKRDLVRSQLSAFGFAVKNLDRSSIYREIMNSARGAPSDRNQNLEWPALRITPDQVVVDGCRFRSLELTRLPETHTELGMIQALTSLPYPMDLSLRLKGRAIKPITARLERKRNLLQAKRESRNTSNAEVESQIEQIEQVLRSLADSSESVLDMRLVVGLRLPEDHGEFLSRALGHLMRAAGQMDFCELEEGTLNTFDHYLECIPGFIGSDIISHTVLSSNATHFLPFLRPSKGDYRQIATFQTREGGVYGIDPVDSRLANYNWLVSGTSGAGKSFFVNSLLSQSLSLNPNIFIVDIGGSYNKLTRFIDGHVMSLEPGHGFQLSPFFLNKESDPSEERMRRQHILQIFLEMTRIDGALPSVEVRHLLTEQLESIFEMDELPAHPISYLVEQVEQRGGREGRRLGLLLRAWKIDSFYGQFLDHAESQNVESSIMTFDLKGLTEFEDLARVVQLILCASLWARVRRSNKSKFSWIVLDEVAFSLLKTQPQFVDELISTLRKYYGGVIVIVQDLEKVTSNLAGSSILQNTQSKAILQQRGDPKNYSAALSLDQLDLWAIESLGRVKGSHSDIYLIRDNEKTIIRHVPSSLEYWIGTTAPEDQSSLPSGGTNEEFRENVFKLSTKATLRGGVE